MHRPEQQLVLAEHPLPRVRHVVFNVAHAPLVQVWLQQLPLAAHASPSEVHGG
jgi:hypothetical protein